MKILIVRSFPDILNLNAYNVQEIGLAKALTRRGQECGIVLYGAGQRQRALRFWRRAPFVLVGLVLAVVLLRSALLLWLNIFLTYPDGMALTDATMPLVERRFALLYAVEALGGLGAAVIPNT